VDTLAHHSSLQLELSAKWDAIPGVQFQAALQIDASIPALHYNCAMALNACGRDRGL
jgi:hypothetical protein